MYGLIGKMLCTFGKRDELISILLDDVGDMPGCLSYVVVRDPVNDDAIWITEVWENEASHKASLAIPEVQAAIKRVMPMIARFGEHIVTTFAGGLGLSC